MRSLDRIVRSLKFKRLYTDSDDEQKRAAKAFIEARDVSGLKGWLRFHPDLDDGEITMRVLLKRAKRAGVKNYSRLPRCELIVAIKESNYDESRDDTGNPDMDDLLGEMSRKI